MGLDGVEEYDIELLNNQNPVESRHSEDFSDMVVGINYFERAAQILQSDKNPDNRPYACTRNAFQIPQINYAVFILFGKYFIGFFGKSGGKPTFYRDCVFIDSFYAEHIRPNLFNIKIGKYQLWILK